MADRSLFSPELPGIPLRRLPVQEKEPDRSFIGISEGQSSRPKLVDPNDAVFIGPSDAPSPAAGKVEDNRTIPARANDFMIDAGNAATGFAKAGVDLFAPNSETSKFLNDFIKEGQGKQSDWRKAYRAQIEAEIKADEDAGNTGVIPMLKGYLQAPSTFASDVVGNAGPWAGAAKVLGLKAAGVLGAVVGAGGVRGGYHDRIQQADDQRLQLESPEYAKLRETLSEKDAKNKISTDISARLAAAMAAGAAVESLGRVTGVERALAGKAAGGRLRTMATEFGTEALSGGVQSAAENAAVQERIPSESLTKGVVRGAVQEGLMGAPAGAMAGARQAPRAADQPGAAGATGESGASGPAGPAPQVGYDAPAGLLPQPKIKSDWDVVDGLQLTGPEQPGRPFPFAPDRQPMLEGPSPFERLGGPERFPELKAPVQAANWEIVDGLALPAPEKPYVAPQIQMDPIGRQIVVDEQGNARLATREEIAQANQARQEQSDLGLTPGVRQAQADMLSPKIVLSKYGTPFMLRTIAQREADRVGGKVVPTADGQGYVVAVSNKTPDSELAQPKGKLSKQEKLYKENPFLAFIYSSGIHPQEISDLGIEAPGKKRDGRSVRYMRSGFAPLFRSNGLTMDGLQEAAVSNGFLTPEEAQSGAGHEIIRDKVRRALSGERVVPVQDSDADAQARYDAEAADRAEAAVLGPAEFYGIETAGKSLAEIAQEVEDARDKALVDGVNEMLADAGMELADAIEAVGLDSDPQTLDAVSRIILAQEINEAAVERAAIQARDDTEFLQRIEEIIRGKPQSTEAARGSETGSQESGGSASSQESRGPPEGLSSYTAQEVVDRQNAVEQAAADRKAADQKAEVDKQVDNFRLTGSNLEADQAAAAGHQSLLDQPAQAKQAEDRPDRFEIGRSLTPEQRKKVMESLYDVYRENGADKELKGTDKNGNEIWGYKHTPEYFEKSDITGRSIRYYVELPDGRIAHPSELFPDQTEAKVESLAAELDAKRRAQIEAGKSRLKVLQSRMASTIAEANRLFWKQNPGLAKQMGDGYVPALISDGKHFVRTDPQAVKGDIDLLGDLVWKEVQISTAPADAPVADMKKRAEEASSGRTTGPVVETFKGKYGQGFGKPQAIEAEVRLNRERPDLVWTAEDSDKLGRMVINGRKPVKPVDHAAHQAATSPKNELAEPTDAQKDAGNYKKGHVVLGGLDISIENPAGSKRRPEWPTLKHHYGYIKGTVGKDKDHIDVFIRPGTPLDFSGNVFVVNQNDAKGGFDEHKVMIGFSNALMAKMAYLSNYTKGWKGLGSLVPASMGDFKSWLKEGDTKKPYQGAQMPEATAPAAEPQGVVKRAEAALASRAEKIDDVGEKIGGARKDTATSSGGKAKRQKASDDRPAWARRYQVAQIIKGAGEGKWVIHDLRDLDRLGQARQVGRSLYDTKESAEAMIPVMAVGRNHRVVSASDGKFEIWRNINDRKRVRVVSDRFDSRDQAMEYMVKNAVKIIETNTTFGEADLPVPDSKVRRGDARRSGNVKPESFKDEFGFRGVEFGNWNNQEERQQVMNEAYDGLLDLAEVMGVPPKALSLNGELGLAFGARGHGLSGARAHYESDKVVINLTKMHGAGALAHEWMHALDAYFGRRDRSSETKWKTDADGTRSLADPDAFLSKGYLRTGSQTRKELLDAYVNVMETIFYKAEKYVSDTKKAEDFVAASRDELAQYLGKLREGLANKRETTYWKRNNDPASAEQLAKWDSVVDTLLKGENLETEFRRSEKSRMGGRWSNDMLDALSAIMKAVRGRSGFDATNRDGEFDRVRGTMERYSQRLKMLADAQNNPEKTRKVPTSFAMDAKELDQGRGQDYWTTPEEMAARAFQGFVHDRIEAKGDFSPFLNYAPENVVLETPWGFKRPYPAGAERKAINAAFERLISTIQTKETDQGTAMFSRRNSDPVDLPDAIIGNSVGAADKHPDYKAAKAGDVDAAVRLAQDLVSDRMVDDVRALLAGRKPTVVAVAAVEQSGKNKIPAAVASVLASRLGLEVDTEIVQSNSPKRTILGGLARIFASPEFDGKVESGQDYLLVDDTITQGGTFAALASHIEQNGGRVLGAAALTGKQYSAKLKPSPETLTKLRDRFGDIENEFEQANGYGFDGLTESEARYLANFEPADTVRDRILAQRSSGGDQENGSDAGPQVAFRRGDTGTGQFSAAQVESIVARLKRKWANAPDIEVLASINDAPGPVKSEASKGGAGDVEGFFWRGKVYVVADQMRSGSDVARVLFHEALGHFGLRGVFGDALKPILQNVAAMHSARVRAKALSYGLDPQNQMHRLMAAEEVLAELAQTKPNLGIVQRAIAAIKKFFADLGLTLKLSDADMIYQFIMPARRFVETGGKGQGGGGGVSFARAYHGSPYHFDKFSTDKIGTGEGAQAYGWGLYFAGRKEVAEYYHQALGSWDFEYARPDAEQELRKATNFADGAWTGLRSALTYADGDAKKAASILVSQYQSGTKDEDMRSAYRLMAQMLREGRLLPKRTGKLYEVDIPEDSDMLDWDKPLSKQPEKVRQALDNFAENLYWNAVAKWGGVSRKQLDEMSLKDKDAAIDKFESIATSGSRYAGSPKYPPQTRSGMTGEDYYRELTDYFGDQRTASEDLLSAGIKGIRYLDQGSRQDWDGTANYVIFDDKDVSIESPEKIRAEDAARDALAKRFEAETGVDIGKAGLMLAGIEIRNAQRANGNPSGPQPTLEMEKEPFTKEQLALVDAWERLGSKVSHHLYHTTPATNLDSIRQRGLVPGMKARHDGVSGAGKVSLAITEKVAGIHGAAGDVMLRVKRGYKVPGNLAPDLLASGGADGSIVTDAVIPPDALEVKQGRKWVPLSAAKAASDPVREALASAVAAKSAFDAVNRVNKVSNIDQLFALSNAKGDAFDALAVALASRPDDGFAVQGKTSDGRPIILTQSAQKPGSWQLTRFAADGSPWGDSQYNTKRSALDDFLREIELSTLSDMDGGLAAPAFSRAGPAKGNADQAPVPFTESDLKTVPSHKSEMEPGTVKQWDYDVPGYGQMARIFQDSEGYWTAIALNHGRHGRLGLAEQVDDKQEAVQAIVDYINEETLDDRLAEYEDKLYSDDSAPLFSRSGAGTIDVDGRPRPRTNSNGQPIAGSDEAIRNFWRWFGDSKVVDDQGRPLVVYHGTRADKDFAVFRGSKIYFSPDPAYASGYADGGMIPEFPAEKSRVIPVYLSAKKPLDLRDMGARQVGRGDLLKRLEAVGVSAEDIALIKRNTDDFPMFVWTWMHENSVRMAIQKAGFDAVFQQEWNGALMGDAFIVFEPTQIKSAIGNQGTFDPQSDNIMFSRAKREATGDPGESIARPNGLKKRMKSMVDWVDNKTDVLSALPDRADYLRRRYLTLGRIAKVDEIAKGIREAFMDASDVDKKAIYDFLTTAGAKPDQISPELRQAAVDTKGNIKSVGDKLVAAGMLDEAAREQYRDAYLPRLYLKHLLSEGDYRALGSGKKPSSMGYLKARKDLPKELREVILGEIKDPAFLSAMAIVTPMRDVALLDFMGQIARNGRWVPESAVVEFDGQQVTPFWLKSEADRLRNQARYMENRGDAKKAEDLAKRMDDAAAPALEALKIVDTKDFKQIPDTPRYGRLRGLMVRKEIHEDIVGVYDIMPENPNIVQSIFGYGGAGTKVTQWWKVGKVTLNPGSQIRNGISNMIMLQLSGVPLHMVLPRIAQAVKAISSNGEAWQIAKKYGVTEATFSAQELAEIRKDAIKMQMESVGQSPLKKLGLASLLMVHPIVEKAGKVYQFMEQVGKTAKIIDAMEREGKSDWEAALEAQKWMFDYSLVPNAVRYARNAPIGSPFATWLWKSSPRLLEVAALHPQRFIPWVALFASLPYLAAMAVGGDDDDWRKVKELMPENMRKRGHVAAVPFRDENGRIQFADWGSFMPWTMWSDFAMNMGRGEVGTATSDLAGQVFGGGPLFSLLATVSTGGVDPFTDQQVFKKGDPAMRQTLSMMNYLWTLAMPPVITDQGFAGKAYRAASGQTDKFGDERASMMGAASSLLGLNMYGVDPDNMVAKESQKMFREVLDVKNRLKSQLSDRGLTDAQRQSLVQEYLAEAKRRQEKLSDYMGKATVSRELAPTK